LVRRRFLRVDPDNPLVAASLESDWNEKLRPLAEAEQDYQRQREHDGHISAPAQREQILSLASDFPQLWRDPNTPHRERKRMVRLLIEDVTLPKAEQIEVCVRFRGGLHKTFSVACPLNSWQRRKHSAEVITETNRLLDAYSLGEIATILNARGYKTGGGVEFDAATVSRIHIGYGLRNRYQRLRDRGLLTLTEIAEKLKVSVGTIHRWQHRGLLRAHPYDDQNRCLYEDPGPTGPKERTLLSEQSTRRCSVKRSLRPQSSTSRRLHGHGADLTLFQPSGHGFQLGGGATEAPHRLFVSCWRHGQRRGISLPISMPAAWGCITSRLRSSAWIFRAISRHCLLFISCQPIACGRAFFRFRFCDCFGWSFLSFMLPLSSLMNSTWPGPGSKTYTISPSGSGHFLLQGQPAPSR
jgi:hypothetical protein